MTDPQIALWILFVTSLKFFRFDCLLSAESETGWPSVILVCGKLEAIGPAFFIRMTFGFRAGLRNFRVRWRALKARSYFTMRRSWVQWTRTRTLDLPASGGYCATGSIY